MWMSASHSLLGALEDPPPAAPGAASLQRPAIVLAQVLNEKNAKKNRRESKWLCCLKPPWCEFVLLQCDLARAVWYTKGAKQKQLHRQSLAPTKDGVAMVKLFMMVASWLEKMAPTSNPSLCYTFATQKKKNNPRHERLLVMEVICVCSALLVWCTGDSALCTELTTQLLA